MNRRNELSPKEDSAALARFFVVTIQGMRAMARLQSDKKALEQVARVALEVFDQSKPNPRLVPQNFRRGDKPAKDMMIVRDCRGSLLRR
jgi:alcohol dehydrogenase class IV